MGYCNFSTECRCNYLCKRCGYTSRLRQIQLRIDLNFIAINYPNSRKTGLVGRFMSRTIEAEQLAKNRYNVSIAKKVLIAKANVEIMHTSASYIMLVKFCFPESIALQNSYKTHTKASCSFPPTFTKIRSILLI